MNPLYGVDASYDDITLEDMKKLYAAGVRVFMQCLWTGRDTPRTCFSNLTNAKAAGMILLGYISVNRFSTGAAHANQGRAAVDQELWNSLVAVETDVELPGISNEIIRGCVERIVELGKSTRVIYTSYGHWTYHQGNTAAFNDCLLHNALWDENPDVDFPKLPYGGWTPDMVLAEQYSGGTNVEGSFVDNNTFNADILTKLMEARVKYTDQVLDAAFLAILETLGQTRGIAVAAAGAVIDHIATHPGGGSTITMENAIATLRQEHDAMAQMIAGFQAACDAAKAKALDAVSTPNGV